jgi:NADH-quinone oxidoreductase subunit L
MDNFFGTAIFIAPTHTNYQTFASHFSGWLAMGLHGLVSLPFALVLLGAAISWLLYVKCPQLPAKLAQLFKPLYWLLQHKYGFDLFNQWVLMPMTRGLGWICWRIGDKTLIDGLMVNGSARMINRLGKMMRTVQSGYIYHYALAMVLGLLILLLWLKR